MQVRIADMPRGIVCADREIFDAYSVSLDPTQRYAVAEIFRNELFVAFRVSTREETSMAGEYVDHFSYSDDTPMLLKFTVEWGCIEYGFCKLNLWAPEMIREFGGRFDRTVKRFYFDWELYRASYERINGVPCPRKGPDRQTGCTGKQERSDHDDQISQ